MGVALGLLLAAVPACFSDPGSSSTSSSSASDASTGSSGGTATGATSSGTSATGSTSNATGASTGMGSGSGGGDTGVPVGCGNGQVDPGEECDDGNTDPGDACHSDCTLYKLVFVSEMGTPGKADGLDGADAICQQEAQAAGVSGVFRAWLSTDSESPSTRFTKVSIPYRRPDGIKIADDWADLTDGTLAAPINLGLDGAPYPDVKIWTGTQPDGTSALSNCSNWTTSGAGNLTGAVGSTAKAGGAWSQDGTRLCNNPTRLYCFQQ